MTKTETRREDGRYLIYFTFPEENSRHSPGEPGESNKSEGARKDEPAENTRGEETSG
ncbi:MAG: hypothetical protein ABI882_04645 [Acidobacteriota bacterium]